MHDCEKKEGVVVLPSMCANASSTWYSHITHLRACTYMHPHVYIPHVQEIRGILPNPSAGAHKVLEPSPGDIV